jgi:hypothetical protein
MKLEEGEEGNEGGGRHIKAADFSEKECRRKFHGSRMSPREPPSLPRNRPREDGGSLAPKKRTLGAFPRMQERVRFARTEPGWQLGQANQTGRVTARDRRSPPWPYIKQAHGGCVWVAGSVPDAKLGRDLA